MDSIFTVLFLSAQAVLAGFGVGSFADRLFGITIHGRFCAIICGIVTAVVSLAIMHHLTLGI